MRSLRDLKRDDGQLLMAFSALFTVVALFTGLAIDTGILYVTKAKLGSAVDSACLTAVKNLSQGQTTSTAVATNVFSANMGDSTISPNITYPIDQYGNQQVKVVATANVKRCSWDYYLSIEPSR
jgi:Flp pilus assembly protein TadG